MPIERRSELLVVARLPDEDQLSADLLALQAITPACNLVLDFSHVTYVASIHLGQVLKLRQHLHAHDRRICLFGLRPKVRELFRITSLDLVLDLHDDEAAAVGSLS